MSPVTRKPSLSDIGKRQEVIVIGIGRDIDPRQFFHDDRHVSKSVDKPSGKCGKKSGADLGVARHARDFFDLLSTGDDSNLAVPPKREELCGRRGGRHQGRE